MKRLLWKEFRERGWWVLAWVLAILGISLFGNGQTFFGEREMFFSPWQLLPYVIGLLTGAGAYAGELARSQSVFSRPIPPHALLEAKLLFGGLVCLGTPLLAAAITWGIMPSPYHHLATPANLLLGVLGVAWKYWLIYLLGLACSTVISGMAGGILTLVAAFLPLIAVMALLEAYIPGWYGSSPAGIAKNLHFYAGRGGWFVGAWLGITIAGLSITRFALVLSNDERIKRFTLFFLSVFLICGIAGLLLPSRMAARLLLHREIAQAYVSPTGQYAMVTEIQRPFNIYFMPVTYPYASFGDARYLVRLHDSQRLPLPELDIEWSNWNWNWEWLSDKVACVYILNKKRLFLVYPERGDRREVYLPGQVSRLHSVSPDGRLLAVEIRCERQVPVREGPGDPPVAYTETYRVLTTLDLQTGRIRDEQEVDPRYVWWLNSDTLAFRSENTDTQFRHIK